MQDAKEEVALSGAVTDVGLLCLTEHFKSDFMTAGPAETLS